MKIHISREEDDKNLFITQLREALASHPRVGRVTCGQGKFWNGPNGEDVLHIHWPEHLCPNQSPAELRRLHAALQEWQEQAAIVVTVHNEYPHYRDTAFYRAAYRLTYQHADGLIHLGHRSREVVRHRYDCSLQDTDEAVIPHGRYSWYLDQDFRSDSRSEYGYDEEDTVILSFGSIRRPEELELLLTGFEAADIPRKQLLVAGGVVWPSRLSLRHYQLWVRTLLHPVQFRSGFIPHEKVPDLLEVADVLVIPRKKALNSGNVALGFTFGKVVVGPSMGVVGETLRETGNPVFEPTEPSTLGRALEQARALAAAGKGKDNRTYAEAHQDWDTIAERHVRLYRDLKACRHSSTQID
jgi:glycosyltransferase involved in cell wall biosynthesis